jgi:hypothetical protein
VVVALVAASVATFGSAITPSRGGVRATAPRPHNVKLLINGKRWHLDTLNGGDNYIDIRARKLRVEARWQTDARGTGYYVLISTSEPVSKDLARCSSGTSCLVPKRVPIAFNQEMTLTVKVLKRPSDMVAAAFKACLNGI